MKRTPKQQQAGITRLNNAFGGIATIMEFMGERKRIRMRPRRQRIVRKYGPGAA